MSLSTARAEAPIESSSLRTAVDSLTASQWPRLERSTLPDTLWLRRLSLDLRMIPPTSAELELFLSDSEPNRNERWVDRFLDDPMHRERIVEWLDKTLMQRRPHPHVERAAWIAYLRNSVDENKPIDVLVREMITSIWWNPSQRARQRFFLDREGDGHAIARDMGRILFGRDMQCAQCHNHPQIDDYLQIDYHGLLAFVSTGTLQEGKSKDEKGVEIKKQFYVEKAASDAPFESVFEKGIVFRTGPRMMHRFESYETYLAPDTRYESKSLEGAWEGLPSNPHQSRRAQLAAQLDSSNIPFVENWANRLWAMMMGRGLIHPLDMHHASNPPSNPALLQALTQAFIQNGFLIRPVLREIALCKQYRVSDQYSVQANSLPANGVLPLDLVQRWTQELETKRQELIQLKAKQSLTVAESKQRLDEAQEKWLADQRLRNYARSELDKGEASFKDVLKKRDEATKKHEQATTALQSKRTIAQSLTDATSKIEEAKKLLTGDTNDLQSAINAAKSRADVANSEIAAAEKAVQDSLQAKQTQSTATEEQRKKLVELAGNLETTERQLGSSDGIFTAARHAWRQASLAESDSDNRIKHFDKRLDWLKASDAVHISTKMLVQGAEDKIRIQEKIQSANEDLATLALAVQASQQRVAEEERQWQTTERQCEKSTNELDQIKQSLAELEKSASLVDDSQPIQLAANTLRNSIAQKSASLEQLHSQSSAARARLAQATNEFKNAHDKQTQLSSDIARYSSEQNRIDQLQSDLSAKLPQLNEECSAKLVQLAELGQVDGDLMPSRGLNPEQFGWSVLSVTNILENYVNAELAELNKQSVIDANSPIEEQAKRKLQATRQAIDKLRPNVDVFATLFSSGVGQSSDEFFASADQALFMANGGSVYAWCTPGGTNVGGRMLTESDSNQCVKILYRSILTRDPTEAESNFISSQLNSAGDQRSAAIHELVWALVSGTEFRWMP